MHLMTKPSTRLTMSAHNDPTFWQWLAGGLASFGGGLFGYHKYMDGRLSRKADKEDIAEIKEELSIQRGHISKLFDQARENEQRAQDRHERLMERLRD